MDYANTVSAAEDFKDCPIIRTSEKSGTIYLVEYSTSDNTDGRDADIIGNGILCGLRG